VGAGHWRRVVAALSPRCRRAVAAPSPAFAPNAAGRMRTTFSVYRIGMANRPL